MIVNSNTITAKCLRNSVLNVKLSEDELEELTKGRIDDDDVDVVKKEDEEEEGLKLQEIGHAECDRGEFKVVLENKYKEGLKGLNGFSHVQLIWWFSGCDNRDDRNIVIREKPYTKGPELLGTFATRAPERPNPIACSVCKVESIDFEKGIVCLAYFDAFTGTPILDIKPYQPSVDKVEKPEVPDWCGHWPKNYETSGDFDWEKEFSLKLRMLVPVSLQFHSHTFSLNRESLRCCL